MITILTFNFNGYDIIRTHFLDTNFNYVYVTDNKEISLHGWKTIYDKDLTGLSSWEASAYVRYHPFKYTNDDIVLIIDGSITIESDIFKMIKEIQKNEYDICVMLSYQNSCKKRISDWYVRNRLSSVEALKLDIWMDKLGYKEYNGCLANAVKIVKNTNRVKEYNELCWKTISEICDNDIVRLDEIITTIILDKYFNDLKVIALPIYIINSNYLKYHFHDKVTEKYIKWNPLSFYTQNKNIKLMYIGKEYNRTYEYKTEAMCLTKFFDESGLIEWIEHHLNLGFDHLHIFDNESSYPCEEICKRYDKVSYELIKGSPRHYKIFNDYVNNDRCKSEWIIPIDDDEYLELNTNICNSVNELIDYYVKKYPDDQMFSIRWKHLFPKKFHSECEGKILEYCTEENPRLASYFQKMGDRGIKTFVHRYGKIYYEETQENPSGGHVPKHSATTGSKFFNGELIKTCSYKNIIKDFENEPARLIHCRYKGYNWYKNKQNTIIKNKVSLDNDFNKLYTQTYKFEDILETLD